MTPGTVSDDACVRSRQDRRADYRGALGDSALRMLESRAGLRDDLATGRLGECLSSGSARRCTGHTIPSVELRARKVLFETILASGLDPADFGIGGFISDRVVHKPAGSAFWYQPYTPPGRGSLFSAGGRKTGEPVPPRPHFKFKFRVTDGPSCEWTPCASTDELWRHITNWLGEIKYVSETSDPWADLGAARQLVTETDEREIANVPFSAEERAAIAVRIDSVKAQVRDNPELTAEQISGIEEKLDELVEASNRVGKKDWRVMLYGTAFGMIVSDTVPPHVVQGIITSVITGLGHIFGLGGMPSLPPTA